MNSGMLGKSCDSSLVPFTEIVDISSALVLMSTLTEGIFTRVTMTSMTGAWYQAISPAETLMIGLLVLQVVIMRLLQILPLDLSNLIKNGELIGRRRRKRLVTQSNRHAEGGDGKLTEIALTMLRRIDQYDCLLRAICELELHSSAQEFLKLPKLTEHTLSALKRSGLQRTKFTTENNETLVERPVVAVFEDAVLLGTEDLIRNTGSPWENSSDYNVYSNDTRSACELKYALCPLSTEDILHYVHGMCLDGL